MPSIQREPSLDYGRRIMQGQSIKNLKSRNALLRQDYADGGTNALNGIEFGKVNPGQFTPESLEAFKGTQNFNDLVPRQNFIKATYGGRQGIIDPVTQQFFEMSSLEDELYADAQTAGTKGFAGVAGQQAAKAGLQNPYAPLQSSDLNLPVTGPTVDPVSEASLAGQKTAAQETAKIEAERQSPQEQKKQSMREADAGNAITLIADMLAPRADNPQKIYATYAYGRENELTPDISKPQSWIDAEAKRNQLVSMMQLENVAKLKGTGPITEPEQKVLRQAMTVLENPLISAKLVEKELKRVMIMFKRWERESREQQGKKSPDETYEQRRKRILGQ